MAGDSCAWIVYNPTRGWEMVRGGRSSKKGAWFNRRVGGRAREKAGV